MVPFDPISLLDRKAGAESKFTLHFEFSCAIRYETVSTCIYFKGIFEWNIAHIITGFD